ncbi:MCP four helix bundle domain-containing protein [Winogradskyella sp. UBA3174]|jgi:hypothetical protein|uniref:MCP four helix bundle domain-containing protein n=1 Tax=Winogradskyella sp. UBA3174 TaxID=1947785 RepID=UPI0025DFE587|nr:MCP four helix bundle domain-containing protein [Winogradskyella sp. UBA3174]|tara:strand:+ start:9063 stop:9653 length:591 start_codon:yes stop_codon:yes gene_type:complete
MGNKISISNRVKIGFSFAIVFLLVLATNRLDKKRFNTIENSLTSVYEDRLVAKGYVYELNNIFHEQEKLLLNNSEYSTKKVSYDKINDLIIEFKSTKLTKEEKLAFSNFQDDFKKLTALEESQTLLNSAQVKSKIEAKLNRIQNDLDNLAKIQISEGQIMTQFAQKSLNSSATVSKIEIAVIILIGIAVQFIIFYK